MTAATYAEILTFAGPYVFLLSFLVDDTRWPTICKVMRWKVRRSGTLSKGQERHLGQSWPSKSNYETLNANAGRQMAKVDKELWRMERIQDRKTDRRDRLE